MRISGFVFAALLTGALASPGAAQRDSSGGDEEIVVQGNRIPRQQIRSFVNAVTHAPYEGQLSRFHARVCPAAMGLSAPQNAAVAERMRRVAGAAGVPLAPAGCTANVFVILVQDKRAAIEQLKHRYPIYLSGMTSSEVEALESSAAPALAWQISSRLSSDGRPLEQPIGSDYYRVQGTMNPSRIRSATEPTFVASVVIIDLNAAAGLTTTELADYAAMRTFAATDPDRILATGAPSILGVFSQPADKAIPLTLTYWDLAFLRALYKTDNAYYARYQRGDMEQVIRQELQRAGYARP